MEGDRARSEKPKSIVKTSAINILNYNDVKHNELSHNKPVITRTSLVQHTKYIPRAYGLWAVWATMAINIWLRCGTQAHVITSTYSVHTCI